MSENWNRFFPVTRDPGKTKISRQPKGTIETMKPFLTSIMNRRTIERFLLLILGNSIAAFGVAVFILPSGFIVSGATGIGRFVSFLLHGMVPITVSIFVINVLLFVLAWFAMGWHLAGTIIIGTFVYPGFLDFFQRVDALQGLTNDPLVAMVCGAICMGAGTGIVIRAGGSTGGSDVIPLILHAKKSVPIAPVLYILDCIIMLLQIPNATKEQILLGILAELITAIVLDKVQMVGDGEVQFLIFSHEYEKINRRLLALDSGTTLLHAQGGYCGQAENVIVCIVSSRKMRLIKDAVLDIDPLAFMTVSAVQEVSGRGFSLDRKTGMAS